MEKKKVRKPTIHKTDIILDKNKLKYELEKREMTFKELFNRIQTKYGLDIDYKAFMSLTSNRSSWKLLYAYAIVDMLDLRISDVFEVVQVDVKQKIEEKKEWKRKYQHNKK